MTAWQNTLQVARFLVVGAGNTLLGLAAIFIFLRLGAGDVLANALGYGIGLLFSFFLNRTWTFRHVGLVRPAVLRFIAVFVVAYSINLATVMSFARMLGAGSFMAQASGIIPYTVVFFLGNRYIVFRKESHGNGTVIQRSTIEKFVMARNMISKIFRLQVGFLQKAWPLIVLTICALLVFATAPKNGDFSWSEAPRNALNGAFVLDFIKAMPWQHPKEWAYAYYYQYPALTILFYPPLFYIVIAVFYAIFGVSHAVAVASVCVFLLILSLAVYSITLRFTSKPAALAAALFVMAAPEVMNWARQVMLDIPMLALVSWAAYWILCYDQTNNSRDLAIAAILIVSAAYVKQTALILAVVFIIVLGLWKSWGILRRFHVWIISGFSLIALIPLVFIQLQFGRFNVATVANRADVSIPRGSLQELTWYGAHLNLIAGVAAIILAIAFIFIFLRRYRWGFWNDRRFLIMLWFVVCYAALTAIHLKELRHGLLLAIPIAILAALVADLTPRPRMAGFFVFIVALSSLAWTFASTRTPSVTGYLESANWVVDHLPENGRVLFAGKRDGSFIFNIRAREDRKDIGIVRADKLFLNINIMPELGLNPKSFSESEMASILNRFGISYVVTVPGIWSEAKVMGDFHKLLATPQFTEITRIPVNGETPEKELVIYKNEGHLKNPPDEFTINLPATGMQVRRSMEGT